MPFHVRMIEDNVLLMACPISIPFVRSWIVELNNSLRPIDLSVLILKLSLHALVARKFSTVRQASKSTSCILVGSVALQQAAILFISLNLNFVLFTANLSGETGSP